MNNLCTQARSQPISLGVCIEVPRFRSTEGAENETPKGQGGSGEEYPPLQPTRGGKLPQRAAGRSPGGKRF